MTLAFIGNPPALFCYTFVMMQPGGFMLNPSASTIQGLFFGSLDKFAEVCRLFLTLISMLFSIFPLNLYPAFTLDIQSSILVMNSHLALRSSQRLLYKVLRL